MASIAIYELITSSLAEIDIDEMSSLRGGRNSLSDNRKRLISVSDLEAVNVLIPNEKVLNKLDSLSFGEIRSLFDLMSLVGTEEVPTPGLQISRRGFVL